MIFLWHVQAIIVALEMLGNHFALEAVVAQDYYSGKQGNSLILMVAHVDMMNINNAVSLVENSSLLYREEFFI